MARRTSRLLACAGLALACSERAEPRPQLVVLVDTNAPVVSQLLGDAELPEQAAIDTVRIDVLEGAPAETRELVAPDETSWPLSFGIAAGGPVLVRIRAFQAAIAAQSLVGEPLAEATIDRVIALDPPSAGAERARIVLDLGCIGTRPDFVARRTCLDFERRREPFEAGVVTETDADAPSLAGKSALLETRDCTTPAPAGALCIRGGFSLLGDVTVAGLQGSLFVDPVPLRPMLVEPFWLDRTELTVGELRALVEAGRASVPADQEPGCTWDPSGASDALPLSCIAWDEAAAVCEERGGRLPSEAEWEHAARGRGRGLRHAWGNAAGTCCAASILRQPDGCGEGIEPVGSHVDADGSCGQADVSRDGVLDLGGSLSEHTLDVNLPYDAACWGQAGLSTHPRCDDPTGVRVTRGGNWGSGFAAAQLAARAFRYDPHVLGLRCAYPGVAP